MRQPWTDVSMRIGRYETTLIRFSVTLFVFSYDTLVFQLKKRIFVY